MNDSLERLFEAVRAAAKPAQWSRGVELSRAGKATFDRQDEDEYVFRIAARGGMIARTVSLYADDAEWECGCDAPGEACEHVAAAVITWKRSAEAGIGLAEAAAPAARVAYRFSRSGAALALARVLVTLEGERRLDATLTAHVSGRIPGPVFSASQADLSVELALATHRHGELPRGIVPRLFARLAHCTDVMLDGKVVRVSAEPLLPEATLEEQGEGFRLTLHDSRELSETFRNGVARCGDTLRPIGEPRLTGRELSELARGKSFGPGDFAELVTQVLPGLRRRIPLRVETDRLPEATAMSPRMRIETTRAAETLSVLATLVYGDPPCARIDGGRLVHLDGPVPLRDETAERRVVTRLRSELGLSPGVREEFEGEAAVGFASRLDRWDDEVEGAGRGAFRLEAPLTAEVRVTDGRLDVTFVSGTTTRSGAEAGAADPQRVLRAWRDGGSLAPLLGGGWAPLPADWLERHGHRVADLLAARESDGSLPRGVLPDLARLCDDLELPPPPSLAPLRALAGAFERLPSAELPTDLRATLRRYQREGVDWLCFMRDAELGALLADDMGLGKTLQTLCALRGRTLVVAPTSVLHNWADEIRRFRPALRCATFHGPERALDATADVTLTTYALLRLDVERLAAEDWEVVVLDEAQAVKNPESQVAMAAFRLRARWRVALSGTPVENRLEELWSQMHFLARGLLGGRSDFAARYADPIAAGDAEAARRLRERIRPFVLRRMKSEVAPELPPRTDVVLRCELTADERAVYDAVHAATREEVVRSLDQGGGVLAALEALLRLRQAACHVGLVPGHEAAGSSKLELLLDSLQSVIAEGHRALVFSQWTSLLDRVEPSLREAGIGFGRLDGATRDRGSVVREFQAPEGPSVLLVSLRAGGTGINLTAADHVFLLDPWWNPAVEDQAADRAHRIGQSRPVLVHRLVAQDTVEERILELQQHKRGLAEAALSEAAAAGALTRADLMQLLA